jgi:hypothetical protein
MITVNELITALQELKDKGYGELPIIYASDDEGNSYSVIIYANNTPSFTPAFITYNGAVNNISIAPMD